MLYLAATFALLQPLLSDPAGSMPDPRALFEGPPAIAAFKDGFLLAWLYAWGWHAVTTDPLGVYQANAFHPYENSLALSTHSIGKIATAGPVFGLTGNPILAYQIDLALCFALSGLAVFVYLRHAEVGFGAALLAGAVFAFAPARLGVYFQTQILGWAYLPLALLLLDRTLVRGGLLAAGGLGLLLLLQCLQSFYLAYLALIGIASYGAAYALVARREVARRGLVLAIAAGVAVGIALVVVSGPYFENAVAGVIPNFADTRRIDFARAHASDLRDYLVPAGKAYVGWLPLGAAVAALVSVVWVDAPRRRAAIAGAAAIATVGAVLSLGPDARVGGQRIALPFGWLGGVLPGFASMRAPDRFQQLAMFGLALLVGFGLDGLVRRGLVRSRAIGVGAGVVFALVVALEFRLPWRVFGAVAVPSGAAALPLHGALADLPPGPVAEFPFHGPMGLDATRAMVRSTVHWKPLANGKSGYEPRGRTHLLSLAKRVPEEPGAFEAFVRLTGVRYVVVDRERMTARKARAWSTQPGIAWVAEAGRMRLGIVDEGLARDGVEAVRACAGASDFEAACAEVARIAARPPGLHR